MGIHTFSSLITHGDFESFLQEPPIIIRIHISLVVKALLFSSVPVLQGEVDKRKFELVINLLPHIKTKFESSDFLLHF